LLAARIAHEDWQSAVHDVGLEQLAPDDTGRDPVPGPAAPGDVVVLSQVDGFALGRGRVDEPDVGLGDLRRELTAMLLRRGDERGSMQVLDESPSRCTYQDELL
jgi:hypothetical protein